MTKDELMTSAKTLIPPDHAILNEFTEKRDSMSAQVVENLSQRDDLDTLIGKGNATMMRDNAFNMARFMESMFTQFDPATYVETIIWVFRAYRSHGFHLTFWSAHLNTWIQTIQTECSEKTTDSLIPFYEWIQIHIPAFTLLSDAYLHEKKE